MLDDIYGSVLHPAVQALPLSILAWLGIRMIAWSARQENGDPLLGGVYSFLATWALITFATFNAGAESTLIIHALSVCLFAVGSVASLIRIALGFFTRHPRLR